MQNCYPFSKFDGLVSERRSFLSSRIRAFHHSKNTPSFAKMGTSIRFDREGVWGGVWGWGVGCVVVVRFTNPYTKHMFYPVLCPKLTLIQPTWSAYPYHLVFLIWYQYSLVFLIWYPYAPTSLYGNTAHCSGCGVAMGCYGLSIVPRTAIVTSQ